MSLITNIDSNDDEVKVRLAGTLMCEAGAAESWVSCFGGGSVEGGMFPELTRV